MAYWQEYRPEDVLQVKPLSNGEFLQWMSKRMDRMWNRAKKGTVNDDHIGNSLIFQLVNWLRTRPALTGNLTRWSRHTIGISSKSAKRSGGPHHPNRAGQTFWLLAVYVGENATIPDCAVRVTVNKPHGDQMD